MFVIQDNLQAYSTSKPVVLVINYYCIVGGFFTTQPLTVYLIRLCKLITLVLINGYRINFIKELEVYRYNQYNGNQLQSHQQFSCVCHTSFINDTSKLMKSVFFLLQWLNVDAWFRYQILFTLPNQTSSVCITEIYLCLYFNFNN